MNECLQRLRAELDKADLKYEVVTHPVGYTAQHEAAAAHVPGHSYAKSVVVFADGKPIQLVLPAPHHIDLRAVHSHLGAANVSLANEEALMRLFPDSEPGAMPPIPSKEGVPVYLDSALATTQRIVFDAGSHTDSLSMSTPDYLRFVDPPIFEFGTESIPSGPTAAGQPPRGSTVLGSTLAAQLVRPAVAAGVAAGFVLGLRWFVRLPAGKPLLAFIAGNATGIAGLALTDPRSGGRRRALIRDKSRKYARQGLRRLHGQAIRAGGAAKRTFHKWRRTRAV